MTAARGPRVPGAVAGHGPTLDMLSDVLAALSDARAHGYSLDAAWWAAADRLADVGDPGRVRAVAVTTVALLAVEMRPASGVNPQVWAEAFRFSLAMAVRER